MRFFGIAAEYLHLYIGRRAATPTEWAGMAWIPFTIGAVRLHPESGLVIVTPITPTPALVDFGFSPDVIVRVEHTDWTSDPRPLVVTSAATTADLTAFPDLDWDIA